MEEMPKNKDLSEEDQNSAKALFLLWILASTNSLDILTNETSS